LYQATDLIGWTVRWNSLVQSFSCNALSRAPNIFNRRECNRSEPPTAGRDQEQNDWYYNDETASNFPAELAGRRREAQ
jgi:hypothetical protein